MKKYLIALSALAFATTSCYEKLNIAPPNAITNEQVQELLKTADDETVQTILGAIANTLKPEMYGSGYNFRYSGNLDGTWSGQLIARLSCGNDIVEGKWQNPGDDYYNGENITSETNANNPSWWHRAFKMTTTANKAATMINEELIAENPSNLLKQYLGQVYIVRAFGYLYAQETFGTNSLGMPIYTKYDIGQPAVARASAKETLDSVIRWATRADALFEAGRNRFQSDERKRPDPRPDQLRHRPCRAAGRRSRRSERKHLFRNGVGRLRQDVERWSFSDDRGPVCTKAVRRYDDRRSRLSCLGSRDQRLHEFRAEP